MNTSKQFSSITAALALVLSLPAGAVEIGKSVESAKTLKDYLAISYYGYFYGPSVTRLGGSVNPDVHGIGTSPVWQYNSLEVAAKTGANTKAFIQGRFRLTPVQGKDFFGLMDPRIGFGTSSLVSSGAFSMSANALLEPNVTTPQTSRITGVRATVNPQYNPAGSRWSAEAYSYVTYYLHGSALTQSDKHWLVYSAPAVTYMFSKNFGARLYWEALDVTHTMDPNQSDRIMDAMNIQPRLTWDITKSLNVQPYVKFFPASVTGDNTSVGVEINGVIL